MMHSQIHKTRNRSKSEPVRTSPCSTSQYSHPVLKLQQQIGNQAVQRLLQSRYIQAKLTIGQPNDKYEQEADRVADRIMYPKGTSLRARMPAPTATTLPVQITPLARQQAPCSIRIQRKAGDVLRVNEFNLTMFLSSYESGSLVPPVATKDYLTNPPLLKMVLELRDKVLSYNKQTGTTVGLLTLLFLASNITTHKGTIFFLCHNVTKGFARGSKALNITKLSKRNYYKIFDKSDFGDTDSGDWYHYFTMAIPAYYFSKNKVETKRPTLPKEAFSMSFKRDLIMAFKKLIAGKMKDSSIPSSKAYTAWLNANALSFLEGVYWGHSQNEVNGESRVHVKGASMGIKSAGQKVNRKWKWYVPICKGFLIPNKSKEDSILESFARVTKEGIKPYTYEVWDIDGKLVRKGYIKVPPPPSKPSSPAQPLPPAKPPTKPTGRSGYLR